MLVATSQSGDPTNQLLTEDVSMSPVQMLRVVNALANGIG